jgi:predicted nucleic acid-binding protein
MELRPGQIAISSMGCAELLLGAELSGKPVENRLIVERFTEPLQKLNFDQSAAVVYSSLRAHLQKEGALIAFGKAVSLTTFKPHPNGFLWSRTVGFRFFSSFRVLCVHG